MAEPKRIEEDITTADLAARRDKPYDPQSRPQLLRDEPRAQPESIPPAAVPTRNDSTDRLGTPARFSDPSNMATVGDVPRVRDEEVHEDDIRNNDSVHRDGRPTPLFAQTEVGDYRSRWTGIQTAFVDEPRKAVKDADRLVASLMTKLAEGFANEREGLEKQWDRGDSVSTEDLRLALQRYRSFFDRLLAA